MITIESNTETEVDMVGALEFNGYTAVVDKPQPEETEATEATEKPGVEVVTNDSADFGKKIAANKTATVADEESESEITQEQPQKEKPKGGFKRKLEKFARTQNELEQEVEDLRARIHDKDGSVSRLQRELEEAQAKLSALKTPEADKKATELKRPVEPDVPDLEELDFDTDKYKSAMKEYRSKLKVYREEMETYQEEKTSAKIAAEIKRSDDQRKQQEAERIAAREVEEFEKRRDAGKGVYEDFDELMAAIPDGFASVLDTDTEAGKAIKAYIVESDNPAHLLRHLALDLINNDSKLNIELLNLNPVRALKRIIAIESDLIQEHDKQEKLAKLTQSKTAPKADAKDEQPEEEVTETAPAKPAAKREAVEEPIKALGGRSTGSSRGGNDYDSKLKAASDRGDYKEFNRLRNEHMIARAKGKA